MPTITRIKRVVHQKRKGPIDPRTGERVRALRLKLGLKQADLAGSDFTKGFISLVETGRTRMSLRAAEIIAGHLGVSVGDIVQGAGPETAKEAELLLLRGEVELRAGRLAGARELAKSGLAEAIGVLKARWQRLQARVLLEERRPRDAVRLLDEAARTFRAAGETEALLRTLFDLAQAHARLEERGEALSLAQEVERALVAGTMVDRTLELQVLCFVAAMYVNLGDFGSADIRTERARALAEDVSDRRTVAQLYESISITRQEQGDYEAALTYARRALEVYEGLGLRYMVGSTWNTIGWVLIQRQQYARSAEALNKAERIADETHDQRLRAYVLQTRAELELARGHAEDAANLAKASLETEGASERARAFSLLVKAQAVAKTKASLATLNAAFEEAIEALAPFGRRQQARAHELHFDALTARGHFREAAASARKALELMRPRLA